MAGGSPAGVVETSLKKLRDLSGVPGESCPNGIWKLILNGIRVGQGGGKIVRVESPVNNAAAAVVKQFKPKFFGPSKLLPQIPGRHAAATIAQVVNAQQTQGTGR